MDGEQHHDGARERLVRTVEDHHVGELVAVQIVPGEYGVRGRIPVEGVGIGVAEHVVVETECRLHDRLAELIRSNRHEEVKRDGE